MRNLTITLVLQCCSYSKTLAEVKSSTITPLLQFSLYLKNICNDKKPNNHPKATVLFVVNKTATSKVGAIYEAQKAQKLAGIKKIKS